MEKLIKPAEYAKELGISRQAVYAKIKRGILSSKNVEGKLYIVVDNDNVSQENKSENTDKKTEKISSKHLDEMQKVPLNGGKEKDYESLLQAKDETIDVLKGTVQDLKESNKQITTTLRGEIDLLKEAFHEMRSLYALQLEHKKVKEAAIDIVAEEEPVGEEYQEEVSQQEQWIGIKKFLKRKGILKEQEKEKVNKRLKKAFKRGDDRFMKQDGKLKVNVDKEYNDILDS